MAPVLTAQPANDREIALLQRRLAKLSALLETQEGQLKQVVGKLAGDPGLASIYRTVQGVEASDPESDRKRELMSRLFEANIDLRRRLDS